MFPIKRKNNEKQVNTEEIVCCYDKKQLKGKGVDFGSHTVQFIMVWKLRKTEAAGYIVSLIRNREQQCSCSVRYRQGSPPLRWGALTDQSIFTLH